MLAGTAICFDNEELSGNKCTMTLDLKWPDMPLADWRATYATLHMWSQIVGKTRLALAPMENHWWQVALYVSARGLTTSPIHVAKRGFEFEVELDFIGHRLEMRGSDGATDSFALEPGT